jgi:hypothetical protein
VADNRAEKTERRDTEVEYAEGPPEARVREDDMEPHAGLRYVARLFKILAILLGVMLIAEIIIGLSQQGSAAIATLLVQATQTIVFAGLLWGIGDIALMLIESNHDLRATRILIGRVNQNLQRYGENRATGDD